MYTEVLRSIEGIAIFPIMSLLVFVTFFTAMLIWASRLGPDRLAMFARMPLDTTDDRAVPSDQPSQGDSRDREAR
ncbi:MAG: CcoQ/FixQ family Cbb3-type cytochrome c oxidase assembly chaperone [Acidobacteriota bacterium]